MKKISIITINFNNLKGLASTLLSIESQTYQDFEFIVIDGGSTDGSKELIQSHSDNICYWVSEPDKGIYHAMNKGLREASGEYVIHMNSGDTFFNSNTLIQLIDFLDSGEDIICGNSIFQNDVNCKSNYIWKAPEKVSFRYFCRNTLNHQSVFIKRSLFDRVGLYKEEFKAASDWNFFLHAFAFHKASYKSVDVVVSIFDRSGFSSINWEVGAKEQLNVFKNQFSFFYEMTDVDDITFFFPFWRNIIKNVKRSAKLLLPYGFVRYRENRNFNKVSKDLNRHE